MPQDPAPRAGIGVICRIVGIFPRLVSVLPPGVSCIRKHRNSSVLYRFLLDPRGLVARVRCDKLYFVEFPCDFVTSSYTASHAVLSWTFPAVTSTPRTNPLLSQTVCASYANCRSCSPFYEHSAVRVCCGDCLFCCLSAAGILRIVVVIVFLLDRLLPQLFALCIDLPAKLTCISRYVCRSDAIPNRCWISTILISTTGSIPGRSVCQKLLFSYFV